MMKNEADYLRNILGYSIRTLDNTKSYLLKRGEDAILAEHISESLKLIQDELYFINNRYMKGENDGRNNRDDDSNS